MSVFEHNGDMFINDEPNSRSYKTYFGKRSHRLEVIDVYTRVTEGKPRQKYCLCKCDCGAIKIIHGDGIRKGRTKSCGCWKSEVDAEKAKTMGDANLSHGLSRSRIYKIWDSMRDRCTNRKAKAYKNYGGRGIVYDRRWNSFEAFYEDMKEGYEEHLTIERVDVNGNYTKANCTWVSMAEQQENKTTSVRIQYKGRLASLSEIARLTGIPRGTLYQRYKDGWSAEDIVNKPHRQTKPRTKRVKA